MVRHSRLQLHLDGHHSLPPAPISRSLLEPIRTSNPYATYLEASCDSLDPHAKVTGSDIGRMCVYVGVIGMLQDNQSTLPSIISPLCQRDPHQVAYCTAAVSYDDGSRPSFAIPYDVAVIAVGEAPATYGVPGVAEHCYFVKEVADCVGLRKRIQASTCAQQPIHGVPRNWWC